MAKPSLSDDQCQQFLDTLPDEQVNPDVEQKFKDAIARAQLKRSKPETPA